MDPDTAKPTAGNVVALPAPPSRTAPATGDAEALAQAAAGDAHAWAALVARHLPAVIRCAAYMLGDRAEAEDVSQETFLRLHRKLPDWQGGAEGLSSWLHRVAVNLSIDRRRRPSPSLPLAAAETVGTPANLDGPLDRRRHVAAALATLPERQRAALVLVHYQGFSGSEAADALEISIEALESLLARARRTLRTILEPVRADLLGTHHD